MNNRTAAAIRRVEAVGETRPDDPSPFYHIVPKGFRSNLLFRRKLITLASRNRKMQRALFQMCKRDILFYINTFVWTYDTRDKRAPQRPFITWSYQDAVILELAAAVGDHDLLIEKSRDMGASWMILIVLEWYWHFHAHHDLLLVSRNEEYVDRRGNKKSLFWKIDFMHRKQPKWLLPGLRFLDENDPNRTRMHLFNPELESVFDGEATTGELASGDRRTAVMMDELSKFKVSDGHNAVTATRDVSPCRIFNFTPRGKGNAAFDLTQTDIRRLRMHWSEHPIKRRGLYRMRDGVVEIIDVNWWRKKVKTDINYDMNPGEFVDACRKVYRFDEQRFSNDPELPLRSPWFDRECRRVSNKSEILQELEIRYDAQASPFFDLRDLAAHAKEFGSPPLHRGTLRFDPETRLPTEFIDLPNGQLNLWFRLDASRKPDKSRDYVIGIDIAAGSGNSNSVASVADRTSCELVAQFASPHVTPENFAEFCIALGNWFIGRNGPARLIWEVNGVGGIAFGRRLLDIDYPNLYARESLGGGQFAKTTGMYGWHSNRQTKADLLTEFKRAIGPDSLFLCHCQQTLKECEQYEFGGNGSIVHATAENSEDPSGARENHGDRVIGTALCWWEIRDSIPAKAPEPEIPRWCAQARINEAEAKRRADEQGSIWDD